jgi:hypothetical protein
VAHNSANPRKFVLSPALREEYLRGLQLITIPGGGDMSVTKHMGVPIEIVEDSPGIMVAVDGSETALE